MATTIHLPDETVDRLLPLKHTLERSSRKTVSWHTVIDHLLDVIDGGIQE